MPTRRAKLDPSPPALQVSVRRTRRRAEANGASSTQRIVEAITAAIVERRLMPGTKLAEQQIADIFAVSRTVVRQALNRMSRDRLITLEPARGARVAEPSIEEARQVFEVREMLETAMIQRLAAGIDDAQLAELQAHLKRERSAVRRSDVTQRTRLLGEFHLVLARMLGNQALADLLADLMTRCSLVSLMYQTAHSAQESHTEHLAIADALAQRDGRAAAKLLRQHLDQVERNLRLHPRRPDMKAALLPEALAP